MNETYEGWDDDRSRAGNQRIEGAKSLHSIVEIVPEVAGYLPSLKKRTNFYNSNRRTSSVSETEARTAQNNELSIAYVSRQEALGLQYTLSYAASSHVLPIYLSPLIPFCSSCPT